MEDWKSKDEDGDELEVCEVFIDLPSGDGKWKIGSALAIFITDPDEPPDDNLLGVNVYREQVIQLRDWLNEYIKRNYEGVMNKLSREEVQADLQRLHIGVADAVKRVQQAVLAGKEKSANWTKETPKVPGWYWYRVEGETEIVKLRPFRDGTPVEREMFIEYLGDCVCFDTKCDYYLDGEWFGPVEAPK